MSPGIVSHKCPQFFRRRHLASGGLFFVQQTLSLKRSGHSPHEADSVYHGVEVFVATLLERVEVDDRGILRIGGAKRNCAGTIPGVALQYDPSEIVEVFRKMLGISGTISLELREERHAEKVRRTFSDRRGAVDGEHGPVRGIKD